MKLKKKTIITLLITLIILILLMFGIYTFINSFKEDKEITVQKMKEITTNYENFNKSIEEFAKGRDNFYNQRENTYLEGYASNIDGWNNLIKTYKASIQKVEDNSKVLKENCHTEYADPNINSKCTVFKSTYEAAMNYYISDIKSYNKNVEEFNTWAEANNKRKLNKGKLIIKDYIDYDEDKEFFGKEETNE